MRRFLWLLNALKPKKTTDSHMEEQLRVGISSKNIGLLFLSFLTSSLSWKINEHQVL